MAAQSEDGAECQRIEEMLFTKAQRDFLRAERAPRWDLDPPQREEFSSPMKYMLALQAYVDRCLAARAAKEPTRG